MRRVLVAALAMALLLVLAAPTGAARRPVPTIFAVTPAVIHVGDTFTVTGDAPLYPDGTAKANWCNPGCVLAFAAHWEAGQGSFTQTAWFPGTHRAWFVGVDAQGHLFRTSEVAFEVLP